MTSAAPDQALSDARWNLDPLVEGRGAEGTLELDIQVDDVVTE